MARPPLRIPRMPPWAGDAFLGLVASVVCLDLLAPTAGALAVAELGRVLRSSWLGPAVFGTLLPVAALLGGRATLRHRPRGGMERRSGFAGLLVGGPVAGAALAYALHLAPAGPLPMHRLVWLDLLAVPLLAAVEFAAGLAAEVRRTRREEPDAGMDRLFRHTVWALAVAVSLLFTAVKIYQYRYWLVGAWDLGIYFTAMAAIGRGDGLGRTTLAGGPIVADAGQWILYLLAPLFRAGGRTGGPWLMFALQGFALGLGAVPLALTAWRAWGRSWWALAVPTALWAFPATVAVVTIDWHPDALAFAFLAWGLWADDQDRPRLYYGLVALALLSKNQAVVPVAGMALWQLISGLRGRDGGRFRRGLVTLVLALGLFLVSEEAVLPALGVRDSTVRANYGYLGGSVPAMLESLLLHPRFLADAVRMHPDTWSLLLGSLAWLPLLAPVRALPGFAVLLVNGLSRVPLPNLPYSQYPLWALPFLAAAAVDGIRAVAQPGRKPDTGGRLRGGRERWVPATAGALLLAASLLVTLRWSVPMEVWRLRPPAPRVVAALDAAERMIPEDAVVYGQTGTVGRLWNRPWVAAEPYNSPGQLVSQARDSRSPVYVLFAPGVSYAPIVPRATQLSDLQRVTRTFELKAILSRDGVLLLRSAQPASRLAVRSAASHP
ncbi:MAG: DUF2079 domain-containing protein [Bacillota bacterium]|nr:DUF2079 domain-containing protein [Bacillota bacterium]